MPERAPEWHDAAIVRFFTRLGAIPQSWSPQRAALRIVIAAGESASARGETLSQVFATLRAFVAEGQPGAVCVDIPRCADCPLGAGCRWVRRRPGLKDMPPGQRPRDRLLAMGAESLSDAELVSLLLRDGTARDSALELAQTLISRFGGFRRLAERSLAELRSVPGIGLVKAAQIKAAMEIARRFSSEALTPGALFASSYDVYMHFREQMRPLKKEVFTLVMLDQKHRIIGIRPISEGSLTQSIVHPREVFKPAISESAAAVIFVHNHPSGDPTPSKQDRDLTTRLTSAGELLGIHVIDHVIIGSESFSSFRELGWLT